MSIWAERRATWDRDLRRARALSRVTVGALAVAALFGLLEVARVVALVLGLDRPGSFLFETTSALRTAELGLFGVVAIAFLMWLSLTIRLAASWSSATIPWTGSKAVWSFLIPIVSFYQPYQIVRDLHDQLAPDAVPEPAPRARMDGAGGYRSVAMETAPPPAALPRASIGAWWGLFVADRIVGSFGLGRALAVAAAGLAIMVVYALEGRLEERHRRVRHASDEELEAWGIRG